MAKKRKRIPAKHRTGKPTKRSTKKVSKKPARRPRPSARRGRARKPAASKARTPPALPTGGPFPVHTGPGSKPLELGTALVRCFNEGKEHEVWEKLWSPDVVSCEGFGVEMEWRGRAANIAKNEGWSQRHILHGARAQGPFVGATGFAVRYEIDLEEKATGNRWRFDEVGVYTVRDGAIVREEFMYGEREKVRGTGALS